jgi:hypothetical protein
MDMAKGITRPVEKNRARGAANQVFPDRRVACKLEKQERENTRITMRNIAIAVSALSMSIALTGAANAQQGANPPLQPGETAMEFAQRIDACNGAEIVSAALNASRTEVRVQCPQAAGSGASAAGQTAAGQTAAGAAAGMTGGLGTAGTVAIGATAVAGIAVALSGSSSSTTGTN